MTLRIAAAAAAALTCLSPVAHAQSREAVVVTVSYAGLDLASPAGRRILDARIAAAARRACTSRMIGLRGMRDERQCRAEMHRDAQIRVAQIRRPVEVAATR